MARVAARYVTVLRTVVGSQKLARCSRGASELFLRLLCVVDADGRHRDSAMGVAAAAFPHESEAGDVAVADVGRWLQELADVALIERYEVDGDRLIQVVGHFRPSGARGSGTFPPPPSLDRPQPGDAAGTPCHQASPLEGDGDGDRDGKERARAREAPAAPPPPKPKRRSRISEAELRSMLSTHALTPECVEALVAWRAYREAAKIRALTAGGWKRLVSRATRERETFPAAVDNAIANGWAGIHKPAESGAPGPNGAGRSTARVAVQNRNLAVLAEAAGSPEPTESLQTDPGARVLDVDGSTRVRSEIEQTGAQAPSKETQ